MEDEKSFSEGEISEWNPAIWKMRRLGQLNERIHSYRLNPKGFNPEFQEYNYILWVRDLKNLYFEIYPKLSKDEIDNIDNIKSAIDSAMINFPVQTQIRIGNHRQWSWDDKVWQVYLKYLEILEKLLFNAADKHGLDSPTKGESSLF